MAIAQTHTHSKRTTAVRSGRLSAGMDRRLRGTIRTSYTTRPEPVAEVPDEAERLSDSPCRHAGGGEGRPRAGALARSGGEIRKAVDDYVARHRHAGAIAG